MWNIKKDIWLPSYCDSEKFFFHLKCSRYSEEIDQKCFIYQEEEKKGGRGLRKGKKELEENKSRLLISFYNCLFALLYMMNSLKICLFMALEKHMH